MPTSIWYMPLINWFTWTFLPTESLTVIKKKLSKREFLRTGSQQILFATPGKSIEVTLNVCYI